MNNYVQQNRTSWAVIAEEHYHHFKRYLSTHETSLCQTQVEELGNIEGTSLIHLQCNTGADSISLARMGAAVTGVDFVPENIHFAKRLSSELGFEKMDFIESDVLDLINVHHQKYDIVYSTEGVLCWLPDLYLWAQNVRHLLSKDGFLYLMDGHPFFMAWDEARLPELKVKYPYFRKNADKDDWIGGYASEPKQAVSYSWMYTVGEIITALSQAGLHIEWFHEFDWLYYELSDKKQKKNENGKWVYPELQGKLPFTFSLKATVR